MSHERENNHYVFEYCFVTLVGVNYSDSFMVNTQQGS